MPTFKKTVGILEIIILVLLKDTMHVLVYKKALLRIAYY